MTLPTLATSPRAEIHLDPRSDIPLHQQLFAQLHQQITSGLLRPGTPLERELELSARLGVSRATVRHALVRLSELGLVRRNRGAGTTVLEAAGGELLGPLAQANLVLEEPGSAAIEILCRAPSEALTEDGTRLQTADLSRATRIEWLLLSEGTPVAFLQSVVPGPVAEPCVGELGRGGLHDALRRGGMVPVWADPVTVSVPAPTPPVAGVPASAARLQADRLCRARSGEPLEWTRLTLTAPDHRLRIARDGTIVISPAPP